MNSQAGVYWGRARQSRVSCANAGFESYSVWRAPALGLPALGIVPCAQFHLISKVNLNLCRPHLKDSGKAESTLLKLQPGACSPGHAARPLPRSTPLRQEKTLGSLQVATLLKEQAPQDRFLSTEKSGFPYLSCGTDRPAPSVPWFPAK